MRSAVWVSACVLLLLCAGPLHGEAPELEAGIYILDGAQPLEVNGCAVPFVTDWNNDGAKDLLVGQFTGGNIWIFLNQGSDINPLFYGGQMVESGGVPISVSYG